MHDVRLGGGGGVPFGLQQEASVLAINISHMHDVRLRLLANTDNYNKPFIHLQFLLLNLILYKFSLKLDKQCQPLRHTIKIFSIQKAFMKPIDNFYDNVSNIKYICTMIHKLYTSKLI